MASKNVKVLPNFSEISRVSQFQFLSSSKHLAVLNLLQNPFWSVNLGLAIQRPQKVLVSHKKRWFRHHEKACVYHSPPLMRGCNVVCTHIFICPLAGAVHCDFLDI